MGYVSRETLDKIVQADPRYAADAYVFVGEALDFTAKKLNKPSLGRSRHVTAAELLDGIRKYALREYGPMSKTIFNTWGIRVCRDFGEIVFNMVNRGLLGKTEEDSISDFNNGYDFDAAFRAPFEPEKKRK